MSYYYIVASLPTLVLGEPPPYSGEEMLRLVANVLEAGDLAELALVLEGREAEGCSAFAREWVGIEAQIRNAIVRERAAKLSSIGPVWRRAPASGASTTSIRSASTARITKPSAPSCAARLTP